jgi:hypothetical protein
MTAPPTAATVPEVLRARPCRWLSRLWVRVSLVLLLICAICVAVWWWPRRTMVAVWWAGGEFSCKADIQRASNISGWVDNYVIGRRWASNDINTVWHVLTLTREDREITYVDLSRSNVGDEWLRKMRRFPQLSMLDLHDRQLGPGLDQLRDCANLSSVRLSTVSNNLFAELRRLPQLNAVSLTGPQSRGLRLDPLTEMPKLTFLSMYHCRFTNELLATMPELPMLETFIISNCTDFSDDDLKCLARFQNLKDFRLEGSRPFSDATLEHLSQLESVERLSLWSPWSSITPYGLRSLGQMKNLKHVIVDKTQCSPAQVKMLQNQLPKCRITVY